MIKTKLSYDRQDIYINPYTISYILRDNSMNETTIAFTNGHSYQVIASVPELLEEIDYETKSLCQECTQSISK